jgi:dolichol-phosphate mannosyltransferase
MSENPVPEISIIAPLHNEGPNVFPLVEQVFAAFRNETREIELVLVDDASTDDTWEQITKARRSHPRLRGVRHPRQSGQSAALWTGFKASRGRLIGTLDGDLQNDPADLPRLLGELTNSDLVCGVRTRRMDTVMRRISSSIARKARKAMLGVDFKDTGCNLRAFKRPVLELIPPFNGFHRFMPILANGGGAVVKEVPVSHRPRTAGTSKYGVWNRLGRGIYDLLMVRWYCKRQLKAINSKELDAA